MRMTRAAAAVSTVSIFLPIASDASAQSPFAAEVVSYAAGTGAASGFTNPLVALGSPERFSGEGLIPGCVTPFQPAWRPNEIVSIGVGGSLVVRFDHDVANDPRNPFGIDLLVFGNAFFTDAGSGSGVVGGLMSEGGAIAVSADGVAWITVPAIEADGLFPTLGYLDAAPYATTPGLVESDFLKPVNPAYSMGTLASLGYKSLVAMYDGSGGGAGIDIGALGLASIRYVRVSGPTTSGFSPEIDAFADVAPAPASPDLDGSGAVDASDLALLLSAWGTLDSPADLDGDGIVGSSDIAVLLSAWNAGGAA
ncbi:MAG: hypothetical protein RLZZ116_2437 [Planctomycetota bacterium]|jgi:hypothetical protein